MSDLTDEELIAAHRTAGGQPAARVTAAELGDDDLLLVDDAPARVLKVTIRADGLLVVTLAAGKRVMVTDQPNRSMTCSPSFTLTRLSTKSERDAWLRQHVDAVTAAAASYDRLVSGDDREHDGALADDLEILAANAADAAGRRLRWP